MYSVQCYQYTGSYYFFLCTQYTVLLVHRQIFFICAQYIVLLVCRWLFFICTPAGIGLKKCVKFKLVIKNVLNLIFKFQITKLSINPEDAEEDGEIRRIYYIKDGQQFGEVKIRVRAPCIRYLEASDLFLKSCRENVFKAAICLQDRRWMSATRRA